MIDPIRRLPPLENIGQITPAQRPQPKPAAESRPSFGKFLENELTGGAGLRFSGHAQTRLMSRQIQLSPEQLTRLNTGVERAAEKGAQDSLVMLDNLAFIVSVKNRTVVTAVDGATRSGNIFTQIDSAIIV